MNKLNWVLAAFIFSLLFMMFLRVTLKDVRWEAPKYEIGPFHTPIQTWCSKSGVEYLMTQYAMVIHVDAKGMPISCQRV